jgi:excisionase family DNA binding protein
MLAEYSLKRHEMQYKQGRLRHVDEKLLFKVEEAARVLSISRARLYVEIRRGTLKPVKIGGCTRLPRSELERYVAQLTGEATQQAGSER